MPYNKPDIIKTYTVGTDIEAPMFPVGHILSIDLMDILPQLEPQIFGVELNGKFCTQ